MHDTVQYDNPYRSHSFSLSIDLEVVRVLYARVSGHTLTDTEKRQYRGYVHTRPLFSLLAVRLIGQRQIESKVYFSAVARGEESAVVGGKQFNHGRKTLYVCTCVYWL